MDIMSVLEGAPPRKPQNPTTVLAPELAEPSPVLLPPGPCKHPADGLMPGLHVPAPIRPMARRFTAASVGLPGSALRAAKHGAVGSKRAASVASATSSASGACAALHSVMGSHPPPVRPPTMASSNGPAISAATRAQQYRPPPPNATNTEGAMVGLLLDFWSGPGTRDPARPATPPLEEFSAKVKPFETAVPEFSATVSDYRDTPRRGPKSMAKLKNSRCTVRPERHRMGRSNTDDDDETASDKRARTDKLALGAIYAHLYQRVPFTNASEQNLARIFSDKELRVLMGMNKMTINNYNPATKKYTEKTKQDKVREIIPVIKKGSLVTPREHAQFPAARLRHTDNPAAIARRKASEAGKTGKKRRLSSSAMGLGSDASGLAHGKRPRLATTGKTTALILGKRPTVTDELSKFRDVSLATLEDRQLVEVRSANGRSWIKAQITGIEHPPLDADGNPIIPPVISVRCTVPRKRREDGKPHVVQWRGCSQDQVGRLVFKQATQTKPSGQKTSDGATGVVVALPANAHSSSAGSGASRGRRERKVPMRYRGVEWTDMANLLADEKADADDRVSGSSSNDEGQPQPSDQATQQTRQRYVEEDEELEESWLIRQQHYTQTLTREQHRQEQIRQRKQDREKRERQRRKQAEQQQRLQQQRRQLQQQRQRQRQRERQRQRQPPKPQGHHSSLQLLAQQQAHTDLRGRHMQASLSGPISRTSNELAAGPIRPAPMPLHPAVVPSEMQMRPEVASVRDISARNGTTGLVQDSPTGHQRQWQALPKTVVTTMPGAVGGVQASVQYSPQAMAF